MGGCVKRGFSNRADLVIAILLPAAFALAGWKVLGRLPAAEYVSLPPSALTLPMAGPDTTNTAPRPPRVADGPLRYDTKFVSAAPGQAVHAASLVELKDGRLRAVWFSGSREGAGDVTIQTAVLDREGRQWGLESTLFDRPQIERSLIRYVKKLGNPVIARAPDGTLMLWLVTVSLGGWAGSSIIWSRSSDDGVSWTGPQRLVTSPFLNISTLVKAMPVALVDGQMALPVYHEFVTKFAEILRIDAAGRVTDKVRIPGSQKSLQPVLLPDNARRANVYMRSTGIPAVMTSATADAGRTWSVTEAGQLPNPDSALAGLVTDRGTKWLALNPITAGRNTLAVFQEENNSFQGSAAWTVESPASAQPALTRHDYGTLLASELKENSLSSLQVQDYVASAMRQLCRDDRCAQEFSYPYLLQSRDGSIHLVYTWHRTRIKHVTFNPLQPAILEKLKTPHGRNTE